MCPREISHQTILNVLNPLEEGAMSKLLPENTSGWACGRARARIRDRPLPLPRGNQPKSKHAKRSNRTPCHEERNQVNDAVAERKARRTARHRRKSKTSL